MPLNPEAPIFVPCHQMLLPDSEPSMEGEFDYECAVTEQELSELEAVEDWVEEMAILSEMEHDHLVALALRVMEVEARAASGGQQQHQHKRHSRKHTAKAH
ncbi:hypothetical protein FOA52_009087 [Chlamydomonas sp. UWO 241]|nr:hypothetical protein FOA52_009087 [Chlamydomonas sp. UWO 241]